VHEHCGCDSIVLTEMTFGNGCCTHRQALKYKCILSHPVELQCSRKTARKHISPTQFNKWHCTLLRAGIAQWVQQLATGWTVRGSNSGGGEICRTRSDWPWGSPSLPYNGYRVSFPEVERPGRGVNHPSHLAPRLKKEWNYTSTPPLGLHGLF